MLRFALVVTFCVVHWACFRCFNLLSKNKLPFNEKLSFILFVEHFRVTPSLGYFNSHENETQLRPFAR